MANYSFVRTIAAGFAMALLVVAAVGAQTAPPTQAPTPQKSPAPPSSLAGKWAMELVTDAFTATPALEFMQQGEKLTGTYEGRYGKFPFTAVLKDKALSFSFTMSAEGTDVLMAFKGEVAADFKSIKGTAELAGMGSATWTAKRAEK
jgi:hypothetical protein